MDIVAGWRGVRLPAREGSNERRTLFGIRVGDGQLRGSRIVRESVNNIEHLDTVSLESRMPPSCLGSTSGHQPRGLGNQFHLRPRSESELGGVRIGPDQAAGPEFDPPKIPHHDDGDIA